MIDYEVISYGEHSILIQWENEISNTVNAKVVNCNQMLLDHFEDLILETVPAYQSLVVFLKRDVDISEFIQKIKVLNWEQSIENERSIWKVPVCYDFELGTDLKAFIKNKAISVDELIDIHTSETYPVHFIGFLPGFPYLAGLPEKLHTERKSTPILNVPAGSVAIGGSQTGIYPSESPGGWHIIGRTPIQLFDANSKRPSLFQAGDAIKFESIDLKEYKRIEKLVDSGAFKLQKL